MPNKQLIKYSTKRLDLIAADLELINAELNSINRFAEILSVNVDAGWPPGEYDRGAQEYFRDQFIKYGEEIIGWLGWYVIKRPEQSESAVLIAAAGFFGPPDDLGCVEIGYSVVPAYRGKGFAVEIVDALIEIARKDPRVKKIIARTNEDNIASQKVLENNGFIYKGKTEEDKLLFEKKN
jgi:[ribosomal protein S5]-alanine N-acetyltransferase